MVIKPLLKWAGGKSQLLNVIDEYMPDRFENYFEPFFGGGALYFHLYNTGRVAEGTIGDTNNDLMSFYGYLKSDCDGLLDEIHSLEFGNNLQDYLRARKEYNEMRNTLRKSALLIYLNRHCFNGLYRVNMNGKFNVPFGRYKMANYPTDDHFYSISESLKDCTLITGDYTAVCKSAMEMDFVYFDPPYYPLSETATFTAYTRGGFDEGKQKELAKLYGQLDLNGVQLMLSNTDCSLIDELYSGYGKIHLNTKTSINSKASARNGGRELIILNY